MKWQFIQILLFLSNKFIYFLGLQCYYFKKKIIKMWRCSCFGFSLHRNVLILAIIDVIIAIVSLTFGTFGLVNVWNHRQSLVEIKNGIKMNAQQNSSTTFDLNFDLYTQQEIDDQNSDELIIALVVIVILIIHLAFYVTNLVLGLFLWFATMKKDRWKCHMWFTLTLIIWIITLISFMINLISIKGPNNSSRGKSHSYFSTITSIFNLLYKAYALWIVRNYVNLLRVNNARFVTDYNVSAGDINNPQDIETIEPFTRNQL